jgi:hypothetical protein
VIIVNLDCKEAMANAPHLQSVHTQITDSLIPSQFNTTSYSDIWIRGGVYADANAQSYASPNVGYAGSDANATGKNTTTVSGSSVWMDHSRYSSTTDASSNAYAYANTGNASSRAYASSVSVSMRNW